MKAAYFKEVVAERLSLGAAETPAADGQIYPIVKKNLGTHYAVVAVAWRALAPTRKWIKGILYRMDRSHKNKTQSTYQNPR
jgi:hypothetical protein